MRPNRKVSKSSSDIFPLPLCLSFSLLFHISSRNTHCFDNQKMLGFLSDYVAVEGASFHRKEAQGITYTEQMAALLYPIPHRPQPTPGLVGDGLRLSHREIL